MRTAKISRKTKETQISLELNIDGSGKSKIKTPVNFLNHMLENFAKHASFDLTIDAKGDIQVEDHHLVEDIGLCLGEALDTALGDKKGINRMGHAIVPLDESLATVALDLSGRPYSIIKIFEKFELESDNYELFNAVRNYLFDRYLVEIPVYNKTILESINRLNATKKGSKRLEVNNNLKEKLNQLNHLPDFLVRDAEGIVYVIEIKNRLVDAKTFMDIINYTRELNKITGKDLSLIIIGRGKSELVDSLIDQNNVKFIDLLEITRDTLGSRVGDLRKENIPHFLESFAAKAKMNLNIKVEGKNDHHKVEASFKALARALRDAVRVTGKGIPSTKGVI